MIEDRASSAAPLLRRLRLLASPLDGKDRDGKLPVLFDQVLVQAPTPSRHVTDTKSLLRDARHAIATEQDYQTVYDALSEGCRTQRAGKRKTRKASARNGVNTKRKWFRDYMASIGWKWTPTMHIGSGCTVHLRAEELPAGRLIVAVSKHYCAVIDGIVHDIYDPRREVHCTRPEWTGPLKPGEWLHPSREIICSIQRRCVYGYWSAAAREGKI